MERSATVSVVLSLALVLIASSTVFGQRFQLVETFGDQMDIVVTSATIDDEPLANNDEIGVFNSQGSCNGWVLIEGDPPYGFSVYGQFMEPGVGFQEGEVMNFKFWDATAGEELDAVTDQGNLQFEAMGLAMIALMEHELGPEIAVSDPNGHDFGEVEVESSALWSFTIMNQGQADLEIATIESSLEVFYTDFDNEQGAVLEPQQELEVSVTFAPVEAIEYIDTLTISSNDEDEYELEVPLSGVGVAAGAPEIHLSEQSHDFGEVYIGETASFSLRITNEGSADLSVFEIDDDNQNADVFATDFDNQEGAVIEPGNFLDVEVTYSPQEAGEDAATLTVSSDDHMNPAAGVELSGTGVIGPHFRFDQTGFSHLLIISDGLLDGNQLAVDDEIGVFTPGDDCAGAVTLTEQDGVFPAGFSAYGAEGENPGFRDGDVFAFKVWDHANEAEYDATVIFEDGPEDWEVNGFTTLRLNAQSEAAPEIEIAEEYFSHDFGDVGVDNVANWFLRIDNIGGETLTISEIRSNDEAFYTDVNEQVGVEPDDYIEVEVSFNPPADEYYSGTLTIVSDDADEGEVEISVEGTGVLEIWPEITVEPLSIDFGEVDTRDEVTEIVEIRNSGTDNLTVTDIELFSDYFYTDFGDQVVLAPNDTYELHVTFAPTDGGDYYETMYIYSDALNVEGGYIDVFLEGVGIIGPHFRFERTGVNHTILITEATLDGASLAAGDEIGIFTPDDDCAGGTILDEVDGVFPAGFSAYGAEGETPGFRDNDVFAFKVWDVSAEGEYEAAAILVSGQQDWHQDGVSTLRLIAQSIAAPEIDIAEENLYHDFGEVGVDNRATWMLEINNYGGAELIISSIESSNGVFSAELEEELHIDPMGSSEVEVVFVPVEAGEQIGALTVYSNDDDEGEIEIAVEGVGVLEVWAEIEVDPLQINFGIVDTRDEVVRTVTVTNIGTDDLTVSDAVIAGNGFSVDFQDAVVIPPDESHDLNVTFSPDDEGDFAGTLTIFSDALNEEQPVVVTLGGAGYYGPHFRFTPTPTSHNLLIHPVYDGEDLDEGDMLGVFTPGGICAGAVIVQDPTPPIGLPAFGDNPGTVEVDGFVQDDEFAFKLWDASAELELDAVAFPVEGPELWINGGLSRILLSFQTEDAPEIALIEVAHNFEQVAVGGRGVWETNILNIGALPLTVSSVESNNDAFSTSIEEQLIIPPYTVYDYEVYFDPTEGIPYIGRITINSNDRDEPARPVDLIGVGVVIVEPEIVVSPLLLNFQEVDIRDEAVETVTILNEGTGALTVYDWYPEGAGFTADPAEETVLQPDESIQVNVTFAPDEERDYEGVLVITSDDEDEAEVNVALQGTGVLGPYFRFTRTGTNHSIIVTEALLDGQLLIVGDEIGIFTTEDICAGGTVLIEDQGEVFPAGFAAYGDEPLTQNVVEGFEVDEPFAFKVYDTDAAQEYDAAPIYDNGPGDWELNGNTVLRLNAQSEVAPEIEIVEEDLYHNFGEVGVNNSATWSFTVYNYGGEALTVENITSNNDVFSTEIELPFDIQSMQSQDVEVIFTPSEGEEYFGLLGVVSNDADEGLIEINVEGVGVLEVWPEIEVTPLTIDYGDVDTRDDIVETVFIENIGTDVLTVSDIVLSGEGFSYDFEGQFEVAPDDVYELSVTFSPDEARQYDGTVTIYSDALNAEDPVVVTLTGIGVIGPHFRFTRTGSNHSLLVEEALVDGNPLVIGDEIGVFTPDDVCAGATVLDEEDGAFPAGFPAYSDNRDTEDVIEGFEAGQPFAFKAWDAEAETEYEMIPTYLEGPGVWQLNGLTSLRLNTELTPEIEISEDSHQFDEVILYTSQSWTFTINNVGGTALNVEAVVTEDGVFTTDFAEPVQVQPDESIDVEVTFSPTEAIYYEETLLVLSDDENERQYPITVDGTGVVSLHFRFTVTGMSHNILVQDARLDGDQLVEHDEIGVYTQDGLCAGAVTLIDRGDGLFAAGIAAYGNDGENDGFDAGESFAFRVYDTRNELEYEAFAEYLDGPEVWTNNNLTEVNLTAQRAPEPEILIAEGDLYHDFGEVPVEQTGEWTFSIRNVGGDDLTVSDVVSDNDAFVLWQGGDVMAPAVFNPVVIPPMQSYELTVYFVPEEETLYEGTLTVVSDDDDEGEIVIDLEGEGIIARHFNYRRSDTSHNLLIEEALLDDEPLVVNDEIGVFTPGDLCAGAAYITGLEEGSIGLAAWGDDGQTPEIDGFQANEAFAFKMWDFDQQSEYDAVAVYVDGPQRWQVNGLTTLRLSAQSQVAPEIDIAEDDLLHEFGEVGVENSMDWSFTISNIGGAGLTVSEILSNEEAFTTDFDGEQTIERQGELEVVVTFRPVEDRDYVGRLTIRSDDANESEVFIDLTGTGVLEVWPEISVEPEEINFGEVDIRETAQEVIVITNTGTADLTVTAVDVEGNGFSTDFANLDGDLVLGQNQSHQLTVTFDPEAEQLYEGQLAIRSDARDNEVVTVSLSGEGIIGPHFIYHRGATNHSIIIQEVAIVDMSPDANDEIGVFTPDGLCAGATVVPEDDPGELGLAAWGDDALTVEIDGFEAGQPFAFKIWDFSAEIEYEARSFYQVWGPQEWVNGGVTTYEQIRAIEDDQPFIRLEEYYDFGRVAVGSRVEWELTISNDGLGDLYLYDITKHFGLDEFDIDFEDEIVIAPNESHVLTVGFEPSEEGRIYEVFVITCNDPMVEEEVRVGVWGEGVIERIPDIELSEESHEFGNVPIFTTAQWVLTITNAGTGDLTVSGISNELEAYTHDWDGEPVLLEPREEFQLTVFFTPTEVQDYDDVLSIESDDPDEDVVEVPLNGAGIEPEEHFIFIRTQANHSFIIQEALLNGEPLEVRDEVGVFTPADVCAGATVVTGEEEEGQLGLAAWGDDPGTMDIIEGFVRDDAFAFRFWDFSAREEVDAYADYIDGPRVYATNGMSTITLTAADEREPDIVVDPLEVEFGYITVGLQGEQVLTVRNEGLADLTVSNVAVVESPYFEVDFEGRFVLGPYEEMPFTVTFTPEGVTEYTANLVVESDSPDEESVQVQLHGHGEIPPPPQIELSETEYNFGDVVVDGPAGTWSFQIRNTGFRTLTVNDIGVEGDGFATDFQGEPIVIQRDDYAEVAVTFTPVRAGLHEGMITILSDHLDNEDFESTIDLSGNGVVIGQPEIVVEEAIAFGQVGIMSTVEELFEIHNNGNLALEVQDVTVEGDGFAVTWGGEPVMVEPQQFIEVPVTFSPIEMIEYEGMLTITSNDEDTPEVEVPLSGQGTEPDRHFQFRISNANHSFIIESATLNGEPLVQFD